MMSGLSIMLNAVLTECFAPAHTVLSDASAHSSPKRRWTRLLVERPSCDSHTALVCSISVNALLMMRNFCQDQTVRCKSRTAAPAAQPSLTAG